MCLGVAGCQSECDTAHGSGEGTQDGTGLAEDATNQGSAGSSGDRNVAELRHLQPADFFALELEDGSGEILRRRDLGVTSGRGRFVLASRNLPTLLFHLSHINLSGFTFAPLRLSGGFCDAATSGVSRHAVAV